MESVRWAMIGTGAVTEVKSGPGLYKSENSNLVGVYDINIEKAKDYAKRHGVKKVYEKIEDALNDDEVNAIYISTPPNFHKEMVLKAIEAKKPAYVEKPLALNYKEALEIKRASEEKNVPVFVAYYRRGQEKFITIKNIIESGEIGNIKTISLVHNMAVEKNELSRDTLPWRLIPSITLGGKIVDMDTHVIDIVQFLIGDISEVRGFAINTGNYYDVEDTGVMIFKIGDILATANWCYVADKTEEKLTIVGDKGRIETTGLFAGDVKVERDGEIKNLSFKEPEHAAMPFIQQVVNELIGKEKSNADLDSAINNVRVIDKLLKDYRKKY